MITALVVSLVLVAGCLAAGYGGYRVGFKKGLEAERLKYEKLRRYCIAGQIVEIPTLGRVRIVGYENEGTDYELIAYVPADLEDWEDSDVITAEASRFVLQAELSIRDMF